MATDPNIREQIEPGVMGNTDPAEQRLLANLSHIAAGYALAKGGGSLAESLMNKISSKLSSAAQTGNSIDSIHQLAGLTPEESAVAKPLSQQPDLFAQELRQKWVNAARDTVTPDSINEMQQQLNYINPKGSIPSLKPISYKISPTKAPSGFPLSATSLSSLQSVKDRLNNNESNK